MSSGPVVAMELMGSDAVNQWRALLGPTDSAIARSEAPNSMRARFGTGMVMYFVSFDYRVKLGSFLSTLKTNYLQIPSMADIHVIGEWSRALILACTVTRGCKLDPRSGTAEPFCLGRYSGHSI